MRTYQRLFTVATFMIMAFSCNRVYAENNLVPSNQDSSQSLANSNNNVRIYINNKQRTLYQIALLSDISVTELRKLNKGAYDEVDIINIGDSIVLPADSPLLPATNISEDTKNENKYNLPNLGSSNESGQAATNSEVLEGYAATALQTLGQQDWHEMTGEKLKSDIRDRAEGYAENYVRSQVNSRLIDPIRSAAEDFLGNFGTAQLQFDVSDQARLNNVNLKLFSPWYDSDDMLIFSQLTYQEYEKDRRIGNFGIGQRWDVADKSWLLGYNVFFDHDFKRNHNRLGIGLEAWSDYLKLAANYYMPLSDWKSSKDFDDYLERAARGFDIRVQGYLPSYPHLGASLMFEQYYGKKVALFGKDHLQRDPRAFTVGIDYTPVPLFTIKGEHKQGQNSKKEAKIELTMNYRMGVPLQDQLDPSMVEVARSLKGSRYDLVDRNNFIVLEYKEKKFSIDLAALGEFEEGTVVPFSISVHNAKDSVTISPSSWNNLTGPLDMLALFAGGGDICYNRLGTGPCSTGNLATEITINDINNWSVLVPSYLDASGNRNPSAPTKTPGRYEFDITVTDSKGRKATSNSTWLSIKPSATERGVILDNVTGKDNSGNIIGSSIDNAVSTDGIETIKLQAYLSSKVTGSTSGNGFNDQVILQNYPASFDIEKINKFWRARTSDGSEIPFVDGSVAGATCPTDTNGNVEDCLLIKSIKPIPGAPDKYDIELATTAALGQVEMIIKMEPYGEASLFIYFSKDNFRGKWVALYEKNTGKMVAFGRLNNKTNSIKTADGVANPFVVGNTYEAIAYDKDPTLAGAVPVPANFVWSLVGDNSAACSDVKVELADFEKNNNGPWFNVSTTNEYTMRGLLAGNVSMVSNGSSGLSVPNQPWGNSHPAISPPACAGDQGFRLQVTVY